MFLIHIVPILKYIFITKQYFLGLGHNIISQYICVQNLKSFPKFLLNHSWALYWHVLMKITFIAFYNHAYITIILLLVLIFKRE